jgi:hypothetical protein
MEKVHPGWEYYRIQDSTYEVNHHITTIKLEHLLKEMFQSTDGCPTPDRVRTYHIQRDWDTVS